MAHDSCHENSRIPAGPIRPRRPKTSSSTTVLKRCRRPVQVHAGIKKSNTVVKPSLENFGESWRQMQGELRHHQLHVDHNLTLVCRDNEYGSDFGKFFRWIFDLRDRECNAPRDVLDLSVLSGLLIYSQDVDTRIQVLREHLSELQIKMVRSQLTELSTQPTCAGRWPRS